MLRCASTTASSLGASETWTVALFFGIGLFAESNPLVLAALAFGALSHSRSS